MDSAVSFLKILWKEVICSICTIIYLSRLNKLNNVLLSIYDEKEYVAILRHNDFEAVKMFFIGVAIFIIWLIGFTTRNIRAIRFQDLNGEEIFIKLISIVIAVIFMIAIIIFIDNPILKAMLVVTTISVISASAMSS